MLRYKTLTAFTAVIAACLASAAYADDTSPAAEVHELPKKMRMDEPMTTGMMKKGMKKGDVKSAAEKKAKKLQPMMEQEQKTMPQDDKAKP